MDFISELLNEILIIICEFLPLIDLYVLQSDVSVISMNSGGNMFIHDHNQCIFFS